jgi:putative endonuclease
VTNDIERRLEEHHQGINPASYTHVKRPFTLVFLEAFGNVRDAIACEKQIKGWNRKKKEALIERNFDQLQELSKRRTPFRR